MADPGRIYDVVGFKKKNGEVGTAFPNSKEDQYVLSNYNDQFKS
jgi:hypothetical protein